MAGQGVETRLIGVMLRLPALAVNRLIAQGLVDAGYRDIRPAHMVVLQLTSRDSPLGRSATVTDLAEKAQMTKQSMGYLVDQLVRAGYLTLSPHPQDRRAKLVKRTRKATALHPVARRVVARAQDEWAAQMGTRQMAHLLRLLGKLNEVVLREQRELGP